MVRRSVVGLLMVLASASAGAGQEVAATPGARALPAELRDGRWAISFGVFTGGGALGWSRMVSRRSAFTLDFAGTAAVGLAELQQDSLTHDRNALTASLSLAPGIRRYLSGRGEVASFFAMRVPVGVDVRISEIDDESGSARLERWAPSVGLQLGLGIEWFPTDALSLRGELVAGGSYSYAVAEQRSFSGATLEERDHSLTLGLGRSGLAAALWF